MGNREKMPQIPQEGPIPIGVVLRALRWGVGKKISAFADMIGYDPGYLSQIETGKAPTTDEFLEEVSKALGLTSPEEIRAISRERIVELLVRNNDPSRGVRSKKIKASLQDRIAHLDGRIEMEEQRLQRLKAVREELQAMIKK